MAKKNKKPLVRVDIMGDDPTRGDCQGAIAVGREVSRILKADFDLVTIDQFSPRPENTGPVLDKVREKYYADTGYPDILFGASVSWHKALEQNTTLWVRSYNESLTAYFNMKTNFVPHGITPQRLAAEKDIFFEKYPALLGRQVLGVFMAERAPAGIDMTKALFRAAKKARPSVIFLCGCRRTDAGSIKICEEGLRIEIAKYESKTGRKGDIIVQTYDMNDHRKSPIYAPDGYNPYVGLIASSHYHFMSGSSHSMLSEILASGRKVHYFQDGFLSHYEKDGYTCRIAKRGATLCKDKVTLKPEDNVTQAVAERIAAKYRYILNSGEKHRLNYC